MSIHSTGGGGWDKPNVRDPEQIRQDILNGSITSQQAEMNYGVKSAHIEVT